MQKPMTRLAAVVMSAAVAAIFAGGSAQAVNVAQTTFAVQANVQSKCSASAPTVNFGNYTPGGGVALTANTTVSIRCTKNTPYTLTLNGGTTAGGTIAQRLLASGPNTLQYNLYTSTLYNTILGDGSGGSVSSNGTGAGTAVPVTLVVYGQLPDNPANQAAVPGSYSDTITVSVTY